MEQSFTVNGLGIIKPAEVILNTSAYGYFYCLQIDGRHSRSGNIPVLLYNHYLANRIFKLFVLEDDGIKLIGNGTLFECIGIAHFKVSIEGLYIGHKSFKKGLLWLSLGSERFHIEESFDVVKMSFTGVKKKELERLGYYGNMG